MRGFFGANCLWECRVLSRSLSSHVQLFVWLTLNGCGLFPLGFFPSPVSVWDLIQRMIHTARSLGFHRKHCHVVRCTPTPHCQETRVCLCVCAHGASFCVRPDFQLLPLAGTLEESGPYAFTMRMCVINGVNPLSRLHLQAAECQHLLGSLGTY